MTTLRKSALALLVIAATCLTAFAQTNGESELTKVMKNLLQWMKDEREQIASNKKHQRFPVVCRQMKTAQITPGKNKAPEHDFFADETEGLLRQYQKAKRQNARTEAYNLIVASCIKCHEHECPGPVFTIKTLRIR